MPVNCETYVQFIKWGTLLKQVLSLHDFKEQEIMVIQRCNKSNFTFSLIWYQDGIKWKDFDKIPPEATYLDIVF